MSELPNLVYFSPTFNHYILRRGEITHYFAIGEAEKLANAIRYLAGLDPSAIAALDADVPLEARDAMGYKNKLTTAPARNIIADVDLEAIGL